MQGVFAKDDNVLYRLILFRDGHLIGCNEPGRLSGPREKSAMTTYAAGREDDPVIRGAPETAAALFQPVESDEIQPTAGGLQGANTLHVPALDLTCVSCVGLGQCG